MPGKINNISRCGVYCCDVMVTLWGEEPEEALIKDKASLLMMMVMVDVDNGGDVGRGKEQSTMTCTATT
jgi:hypothetical protein